MSFGHGGLASLVHFTPVFPPYMGMLYVRTRRDMQTNRDNMSPDLLDIHFPSTQATTARPMHANTNGN